MNILRGRQPEVLAGLLVVSMGCTGSPTAPLAHEAYVWQRQWRPPVVDAVRGADELDGLVVLAAEVVLDETPRVVRPRIDVRTLADVDPGAGLALRIGRLRGRFADQPALVDRLAALAKDLVADAYRDGLQPRELQVDFDSTERGLADYGVVLRRLRQDLPSTVRLTFTALPSWLRHTADVTRLAHAADGFVLQVHGLQRPLRPDGPIALCDPTAARRAVARAARLGRPFRVALPTYGYLLAFDRSEDLVEVWAEDAPATPRPPPGGTLRRVDADAASMSSLVRGWSDRRPRGMEGIVWYRLPVQDDRLNWTRTTLADVRDGTVPENEPTLVARAVDPDAIEVAVDNRSLHRAALPPRLRVRWRSGTVLAADGLGGYRFEPAGPREASLVLEAGSGLIPRQPNSRTPAAWLRFDHPPEGFDVSLP